MKNATIRGRLTQRQLAERVGVSEAYISKIFNGKRRVSLPLAKDIADQIGMSLEELCKLLKIE